MNFIEELRWRGMLQDMTPGLEEELSKGNMVTAYIGYDPTAASLTIGNYVTLMLLKIFQKHGHKPIALLGGATGRVGDPSGKSEERKLLDLETIENNVAKFRETVMKQLNFDCGVNSAEVVDNYDFYKNMDVLTFLRDVGKYITVNYMQAKDSVKSRMEKGISFTEFSYQLLQGYDYVWLYQNKNCRLQMGGSDQWGNITTGTDLIGKMIDGKGHALTCPLLTKSDGSKFGKSEKGNIWLSAEFTSPYEFYQFWLKAADDEIVKFNRYFTLRSFAEVEALETEHASRLGERILQKSLAEELTTRLHGEAGLELAKEVTNLMFNKKMTQEALHSVSKDVLEAASAVISNHATLPRAEFNEPIPLIELLAVKTSLFASKADVRRAIQGNALSVNKVKVANEAQPITTADLIQNEYLLVEFGKSNQYILRCEM